MKIYKALIISLAFFVLLISCKHEVIPFKNAKVQIKEKNGEYMLIRNGEPYIIKGAAGSTNLTVLKEMGGNTIRIWDTVGLKDVLDDAYSNNIAVIVGLPIPNNKDYMSFYNDTLKVLNQHNAFKSIVNRVKDHPAVLMWCIGNELDFPYRPSYNNFYKAFNDLTEMIHEDDPDHPVTTTLMNFNKKYILNLRLRCNIDVISFNIFSRLSSLRKELKEVSWIWKGPFMITEWGINGPWDEGTKQTAWGAHIEESSKRKAEIVLNRYQYLPIEDTRLLGSFIFFWGQKQEGTPTWFSMFDEKGAKSEMVRVMNFLWTKDPLDLKFPNLKEMLIDGRKAEDNIILSVNSTSNVRIIIAEPVGDIKAVKWKILKEDWYRKNDQHSIKKLYAISNLIQVKDLLNVSFLAPKEEGPYRIYVTIYNQDGNFSTSNIPFYIVSDQ